MSFAEGILTFISPCILPMIPVYLMYLAGTSADWGNSAGTLAHRKPVLSAVGFVVGFTVVFVLLGATATSLGSFLKGHTGILRKASGVMLVLFGLNFAGVIKLGFLNVEKHLQYDFKRTGLFSSVIFGMVFSFGWTPCLGTFLSSALLMAGSLNTLAEGMLLLLAYSAGLGIPFIAAAVLLEKLKVLLAAIQKHNRIIGIVSGIVLIAAGVLMFTDKLKYLAFPT